MVEATSLFCFRELQAGVATLFVCIPLKLGELALLCFTHELLSTIRAALKPTWRWMAFLQGHVSQCGSEATDQLPFEWSR